MGGCGAAPQANGTWQPAAQTPSIGASASGEASSAPASSPGSTPTPAARPAPGRPLTGRVIFLDPGHNGKNDPAVLNRPVDAYTHKKPCNTTGTNAADGYPEHAFNWDVVQRLGTALRAAGATVVLSRQNDSGVGPCIDARAAAANQSRAAAVVSIHADGGPANGYGFHVMEPARISGAPSTAIVGESHRLAITVRNRLRAVQSPSTYIGQDGINTRSDMAGLNLSRLPVVMVECGNMRNSADATKLRDPAFRQRLAEALAAAVDDFVTP